MLCLGGTVPTRHVQSLTEMSTMHMLLATKSRVTFQSYCNPDSLHAEQVPNNAVLIHFQELLMHVTCIAHDSVC